jgi:hypothetical protein
MALAALKPIKYQGKTLQIGDVLDPAPEPTLAGQLVRGRYAYDNATTSPQTRPVGSGRPRRARPRPAAA